MTIENKQISDHFSLFELTITEHRKHLDQNRLSAIAPELYKKGVVLCETLLEPIRNYFGKPLIVHSGYRCPALNKAIRGSKTSQHILFEACDFHIVGVDLNDVFKAIRFKMKPTLEWGQFILEGYSCGHPSWLHISLRGNRPLNKCQEVKISEDGGKTYVRIT